MKVIHVINRLKTGGAEKLLLDTIPRFNKHGLKTDVLVFNDENTPFYKQLASSNCCTIHNLQVNGVYNLVSIFRMISILKNYEIAHVHLFPAQYFVVIAKVLGFLKIKLVYTEHSTTNRRLENRFFSAIDKWIYRFYDKTIAITLNIQTIIMNHTGLKKDSIVLLENGVDVRTIGNALPLSLPTIEKSIQPSDKLFIQVSSFRHPKDQKTLIKSLSYLPANVKLLLVGEGLTREECENLVNELGLESRVFFLGVRMDVANLLKSVDVVVLSSHNEGMSLSSIEGMASGKPFVASDVPGLTNIVQGAGVLFKLGDAQQLAQVIHRLLDDKAHYDAVVKSCLARAAQYDIQVMVDKTIALYRELHATIKVQHYKNA